MRRAAIAFALALLVVAWPGATAIAADQSVQATDSLTFDPPTVTVNIGDTVTWTSSSTHPHNVTADDGSFRGGGDPVTHDPAPEPWTFSHEFDAVGTFRYFCQQHGGKGGSGMSGKVVVVDPNAPKDTTPPKITALHAKPTKFCTNKSTTCHKRGTKIKFTLSEAAKVTADISRTKGNTGPVSIFLNKQRKAGKNSVKYSGKGLKPGKYVLRLRARDAAGNASQPVKTKVTVEKNG
jgi:plastocyanin